MEPEERNEVGNPLQSISDQSVVSLEDTINALGRSLASYPGFM
jgi:hypothetical protein